MRFKNEKEYDRFWELQSWYDTFTCCDEMWTKDEIKRELSETNKVKFLKDIVELAEHHDRLAK